MLNIQMKYREYCCMLNIGKHNLQCHSCYADEVECGEYSDGKKELNAIPFGDCEHAYIRYKYKGITAKDYEIEGIEDAEDDDWFALVKIGKKEYHCDEVIINDRIIYKDGVFIDGK